MESIKEIFKVGKGPSSSHTMGPRSAAIKFLEKNRGAARFVVTLYGSLAATRAIDANVYALMSDGRRISLSYVKKIMYLWKLIVI